MDFLHALQGRTLVLVAHPDDEAVGCGILLQRIADPIVVFATDGAPRSDFFWKEYGSRERYAATRAREAEQALNAIGVYHRHFLLEHNPIPDQELFANIEPAYSALSDLIDSEMPDAILSLAYEGGHPDHDVCSFLASVAAQRYELPVFEMPLYHRINGEIRRSRFLDRSGAIEPTAEELARKRMMLTAYHSQAHVLAEFAPAVESVRPMCAYDFTQAPHLGQLNYEAWQWPMTGTDLCHAFVDFLRKSPDPAREREWGTAA